MSFATLLLLILSFLHETPNLIFFSSFTLSDTFRFGKKSNKDEIFFRKTDLITLQVTHDRNFTLRSVPL